LVAKAADLVLYNANVLTMNHRQSCAELVAAKDGRIIHVGKNDELGRFRGVGKLINCEGMTVIPGFNDAHTHVLSYASNLLSMDCNPAAVKSIADIQNRIRQQARRVPPGTWINGSGYNEFYLAERRHPSRHDLDQVASYHPVKLTHRSMHACVLNSLAMSLAGISIETSDPPGGLIDRELGTGEPSGLLFGMNSYINEKVIPPLTEAEISRGIKLVNSKFLSLGITSLQDATVRNGYEQWQFFHGLKERGELLPRVGMMFGFDVLADFTERGFCYGYGDNGLRLGAVKIAPDETRGYLNPPQQELNEMVLQAHQAGFQVAIHAVEEGTVEAAIVALEYCLRKSSRTDHRHRLEHCSVCPPKLLRRLKSLKAVVVTQPAFIYYSGERYLKEVAEEQICWLYRTKSFLKNGLKPAASSDCPVVPPDPLMGIYAAVTRKAENGQVLLPEETISPREALGLYTAAGAYASFEEHLKGSIEVGKLADMVVLSTDPTNVPPDEIEELSVEKTIIDGKIVWER
jgi:predicted amidohydrolase YtcJ